MMHLFKMRCDIAEERVQSLTKQLDQAHSEVSRIEREKRDADHKYEELSSKYEKKKGEVEEAEKILESLRKEEESLNNEKREIDQKLEKERNNKNKLQSKLDTIKTKLRINKDELEIIVSEINNQLKIINAPAPKHRDVSEYPREDYTYGLVYGYIREDYEKRNEVYIKNVEEARKEKIRLLKKKADLEFEKSNLEEERSKLESNLKGSEQSIRGFEQESQQNTEKITENKSKREEKEKSQLQQERDSLYTEVSNARVEKEMLAYDKQQADSHVREINEQLEAAQQELAYLNQHGEAPPSPTEPLSHNEDEMLKRLAELEVEQETAEDARLREWAQQDVDAEQTPDLGDMLREMSQRAAEGAGDAAESMRAGVNAFAERWEGSDAEGLSDGRPDFSYRGDAPLPQSYSGYPSQELVEQPSPSLAQQIHRAGEIVTDVVERVVDASIDAAADAGIISEGVKSNLEFVKDWGGNLVKGVNDKVFEPASRIFDTPH